MGATRPLTVRAWSGTDHASKTALEFVAAAGGRQELVLLARSLRLPVPEEQPADGPHPLDPDGALEAVRRPGVVFWRRLAHTEDDQWLPVGGPGIPLPREAGSRHLR